MVIENREPLERFRNNLEESPRVAASVRIKVQKFEAHSEPRFHYANHCEHLYFLASSMVRGGNSLHTSCRNSARTKSFPRSSLPIPFYLKTMPGKLIKSLWNATCSCKPALGSSRAFNNPRLPEALRPCNASIPDKRSASAFHSTLGSLNTADIQGCPTARLLLPLPSDRKT